MILEGRFPVTLLRHSIGDQRCHMLFYFCFIAFDGNLYIFAARLTQRMKRFNFMIGDFCLVFSVSWAPACLAWSRLNKHLAPFLQWSLTGHILGVQWKDDMLRKTVSERYAEHKHWANQMLFDYYNVSIVKYLILKKQIIINQLN